MKKISIILLVLAASFLVACGSKTATKPNIAGFLADSACKTAEKDGDVTDEEYDTIGNKYDIHGDDDAAAALKVSADELKKIKEESVNIVKSTCNKLFEDSGVDPGIFIDAYIEEFSK